MVSIKVHKLMAFLAFATIDRLTKCWAMRVLPSQAVSPVNDWFGLSLFYNRGVAFSFLHGAPLLILILLTSLSFVLCYQYCWKKEDRFNWAFLLIFAGITGNFLDRIVYGYVIDWIHIGLYFNLADFYLIAGSLSLLSRQLRAGAG